MKRRVNQNTTGNEETLMEWKEEKEKTATFGRDLDKMHATFSKMNSAYEMKDNN